MAIGVIAATLSYYMIILRMKIGLDESLDVFACHGVGGMWGMLATGLFAEKAINAAGSNGLFFGNPGQLGIQAFTVLVVAVFSFTASFILGKIIDAVFSLRVKEQEEDLGLDISQHGETAYA